jgi:signal transduction histidine kinase
MRRMAEQRDAPRARFESLNGTRTALGRLWSAMVSQPDGASRGPVSFTPLLVLYVGVVLAGSASLAALTVRLPSDGTTLAVGSVATFLLALYAVRPLTSVQATWAASMFVHLGLAVTLGPVGALGAAAAEAAGVGARTRNGWFRTAFNTANHFIANTTAWFVFVEARNVLPDGWGPFAAGVAAGLCQFAVDRLLLTLVMRITNANAIFLRLLTREPSLIAYSAGYGWAAYAFVVMQERNGALGFSSVLIPLVMLHGFIILFTRRFRAYELQRERHQKEREELLQRAVDASESERRRIARDLHDGVVQNLAGMAYTLMATASQLKETGAENGDAELLQVLEQSAEETRSAMKDLRTLIIEIAPPTLRREGLHAALLEILNTLKGAGVETKLALPSNMRLRQDRASLIFRVAQEVLRNVAAHAEAKHVSVVLKERHGMAVLEVVDDGKGFSAEDVARRRAAGHVGTSGIVELAEDAGGSLTIDSKPGNGTRVTLTVPAE